MAEQQDSEQKAAKVAPVKDGAEAITPETTNRHKLYSDVDLSRKENQTAPAARSAEQPAPKPAEAQSDSQVLDTLTGQVVDKTASPAKTEVPAQTKSAELAQMGPETLDSAAMALKRQMGDKDSVEAILRSIPPANKQEFADIYQSVSGNNLRNELKKYQLDSAAALLEPKEEARNAAWLQSNLKQLAHLPQGQSTQRDLVEHAIRSNLLSMSTEQRDSLNAELLSHNGKSLTQTISASGLSAESKQIANTIIGQGANFDLKSMAEIGLKSNGSAEQKLLILKEALAGDSDAAKAARQAFAGSNGQGEKLLQQAFNGTDLQQAEDYVKNGKLQTSTFIDLQTSHLAEDEKGIELVLSLMTDADRKSFAAGEKLALSGQNNPTDPSEKESLDYYNKVHSSLQNATVNYSAPSKWFSSANRNKELAQWEDIAANGEPTLISRLAKASNDFMPENPGQVLAAIKSFTPKDWQLMQDPTYREKVFNMMGGQDGKADSLFSPAASSAARKEIAKDFAAQLSPEASKEATLPTLKEASSDFNAFMAAQDRYQTGSSVLVFNALMHAKATDYGQLSRADLRLLNNRIKHMPDAEKTAADQMVSDLKSGKDIQPDLALQLHMDALTQASKQTVVEHLIGAKDQLSNSPQLEQAAKAAFGNDSDFQKYGKSILDGKGFSAQQLRDLDWKFVAPVMDSNVDPSHIDQANYFSELKLLSPQEQQQIVTASDNASKGDAGSQKYLDTVFDGMSKDERDIAVNVLKNPDKQFSLADQIRSRAIGGDGIDQTQLIAQFSKLGPQQKLDLINDYAQKYQAFLPDELSKGADETTKKQIDLSLPMSRNDLYRAAQDWSTDTGNGLYGNVASTEISLSQTQNMMKANLLDKLPADKQEQARQEIDQAFQNYVKALSDNDQAKDQYAKDLADKIMTVALTVAAPGVGGSLVKLALAAGTAVAARAAIVNEVKGGMTGSDLVQAGIFGVVDAGTMGKFKVLKAQFVEALEKSVSSSLSQAAKDDLTKNFTSYVAGEEGQHQLAQDLSKAGVQDADQKAKSIVDEYQRNIPKDAAAKTSPTMEKILQNLKENPEQQNDIREFMKAWQTNTLKPLQEQGAISETQMSQLSQRYGQALKQYADSSPENRAKVVAQIQEMTAQMKFVAERAAENPKQAQDYADLIIMAGKHPEFKLPMDRLRTAQPQVLQFYRDSMADVVDKLSKPAGDIITGGNRYEYASQRMLMNLLGKTQNAELKNWAFIPGVGGSSADHMGMDGILVNLQDGRIVPLDLKNNPTLATYKNTIHFPPASDTPVNYNKPSAYNDKTGLFEPFAKPDDYSVEKQLVARVNDSRHPSLSASLFHQFNPDSQVSFPSLGDAPSPTSSAQLSAQAVQLRQWAATNKSPLLSYYASKAEKGAYYLEKQAAELQTAANQNELLGLKSIDSSLTESDAASIRTMRGALKASGSNASDKDLVAIQRQFKSLGLDPAADDISRLSATKIADPATAAYEGLLSRLGAFSDALKTSASATDRDLSNWSGILKDNSDGPIDASLAHEVATDKDSSVQLRQLLDRFYQSTISEPRQRQRLVDQAMSVISSN